MLRKNVLLVVATMSLAVVPASLANPGDLDLRLRSLLAHDQALRFRTGAHPEYHGCVSEQIGSPTRAFPAMQGQLCADSTIGSDLDWDRSFFRTGPDQGVTALVSFRGRLHAFGDFEVVGGVPAPHHAIWDGTHWSAADWPFWLDSVYEAVVWRDQLVLAGVFGWNSSQDSLSVLTVWDGSSWSSLGTRTPEDEFGVARSIDVHEESLTIGGWFPALAGTSSPNVARFDGSRWKSLGVGLPSSDYTGVSDLVTYRDALIAGGEFALQPGDSSAKLARWDGAEWDAIPGSNVGDANGSGTTIRTLAEFNGSLYVGGTFDSIATIPARSLARWDGAWHDVGGGVHDDDGPGWVMSLASRGQDLLVLGRFTAVGASNARNVASWDGHEWQSMGSGLQSYVHASALHQSDLYIGGESDRRGIDRVGPLARWNGAEFEVVGRIGGALPGSGLAAVETPAGIVVAYRASRSLRSECGFARWTDAGWMDAATPLTGSVTDLAWYEGRLIASGDFRDVDPSMSSLAAWDGQAWRSLGGGPDGSVATLLVHQGRLFIGGSFRTVGDLDRADRIASWNGTAWSTLGSGVSGSVSALATRGSSILVAGHFRFAGNLSADGLGLWDGISWRVPWPIPDLDLPTEDVVAWREGVVILGRIRGQDGIGQGLRFSDGGRWMPIPFPPDLSAVDRLATHRDYLVAAGVPRISTSKLENGVMFWDGECWRRPGTGFGDGRGRGQDPTIFDIAPIPGGLCFAGAMRFAGGAHSFNIAIWRDVLAPTVFGSLPAMVLPNPGAVSWLAYTLSRSSPVTFDVFGVDGRRVAAWNRSWQPAGTHSEPLSRATALDELPSGVFFVRVDAAGEKSRPLRWIVVR